jgi:hypothetical protein
MKESHNAGAVLITSCLLLTEDLNQVMVGWMVAAFLVFITRGVKPERVACLHGLSALAFLPVKGEITVDLMIYKIQRRG